MTAALFIVFLSRLVAEADRKIFLIVDHLRAHEAAAVQAWLAEHRDEVEAFLLPRYAPERNADEYLNNDLKENVNAAGLPHNKEELTSHITAFMEKLMQLPDRVQGDIIEPFVQHAGGCIHPAIMPPEAAESAHHPRKRGLPSGNCLATCTHVPR